MTTPKAVRVEAAFRARVALQLGAYGHFPTKSLLIVCFRCRVPSEYASHSTDQVHVLFRSAVLLLLCGSVEVIDCAQSWCRVSIGCF